MKELKEFFTNLVLHGDGNLSESTLRESHGECKDLILESNRFKI